MDNSDFIAIVNAMKNFHIGIASVPYMVQVLVVAVVLMKIGRTDYCSVRYNYWVTAGLNR